VLWFNCQVLKFGEPQSFSLPVYEAYIKGVADSERSQHSENRDIEPIA
jgi:hypothetical protein